MANPEHLKILKQGVEVWNEWRKKNPDIVPDLSNADLWEANLIGADLKGADLSDTDLEGARLWGAELEGSCFRGSNLKGADLSDTDLSDTNLENVKLCGSSLCNVFISGNNLHGIDLEGADLSSAKLWRTNLSEANLKGANISGAYLEEAILTESDLCGANLQAANFERADLERSKLTESNLRWANLEAANLQMVDLWGANLHGANLRWVNLQGANLEHASLVDTKLEGAILNGCRVFGISAWDVKTDSETRQEKLIIARDEINITVGSLEIAQFLYQVIDNEKLSHFIRVMRTTGVLILGSFGTDKSKALLEELRIELSSRGFMPLLFTFDTSETSFPMETVRTLALLSNFVVIDLSEPAGQLAEMAALVPETYVPFIQIAREGSHVTWMLRGPQSWVSEIIRYSKSNLQDWPAFIENNILPCAKEINGQLQEKRKQLWE